MSYDSRGNTCFNEASGVSSDRTSNPKPTETLSEFDHDPYGEPLGAQHVAIDFTPNDDDTELVQKKVCAFWQFINNHPDIQHLKVEPDKNLYTGDSNTGIASVSNKTSAKGIHVAKQPEKNVLEMLKFTEEKKLIGTAFNTKAEQSKSKCSLGSRSYKLSETTRQPKKQVCECIRDNKIATSVPRHKMSPIRDLNITMDEWDARHPKSMKPPGHIPPLQHCLIQRQIFPEPLE